MEKALALFLTGTMAFLPSGCAKAASANNDDSGSPAEASVFVWNGAMPVITSIFTADPSAHVWPTDTGRLYLYPSTDIFPAQGCNLMDRYHVFSTENMIDWIDHGEILRRDDLPPNPRYPADMTGWGPHYDNAMFMWAPDAAYNPGHPEGKGPYFFIFPHATGGDGVTPGWGDTWKLGMAYSGSPYKGFRDNEVIVINDHEGNEIMGTGALIDPCIFEDEGDYYLATGGSQQFRIAKLSGDMMSLAEPWTIINPAQGLDFYHEGPWMFTRANDSGVKIYYLMYPGNPGGGNGDEMLYATSDNPYGPWNYRGSILNPTGTGDTSHGSIVEFKGKWYIFYHNSALSEGNATLRSVCIDEVFFNPDGTIRPVAQTSTGVPAAGPPADKAALDSQFGAGNYRIEIKYSETAGGGSGSSASDGFAFDRKYEAMDESVQAAGGATKNDDNTGAVHNLHLPGSYAVFTQISGGTGGRALLSVDYALGGGGNGALRVTVNGQAGSLPFNLKNTGGWGRFTESAYYAIDLQAGDGNTIRFDSAGVNIRSVSIYQSAR